MPWLILVSMHHEQGLDPYCVPQEYDKVGSMQQPNAMTHALNLSQLKRMAVIH